MPKTVALFLLSALALSACAGRYASSPPLDSSGVATPSLDQLGGGLTPWQFLSLPLGSSNTTLVSGGDPGKTWYASPADNKIGFYQQNNLKRTEFDATFASGMHSADTPAQIVSGPSLTYVTLIGGDGGLGQIDEAGSKTFLTLRAGVKPAGGLCVASNGVVFLMGSDGVLYADSKGTILQVKDFHGGVSAQVESMACYKDGIHTIVVIADNGNKQIVLYDATTAQSTAVATTGRPMSVAVTPANEVYFTQTFGDIGANAGYIANGQAFEIVDNNQPSADPDGIAPGLSGSNLMFINDGDGYFTSINITTHATTDFKMPTSPVYPRFYNGLALGSDGNIYGAADTPGNGTASNPPKIEVYLYCEIRSNKNSLTFTGTNQNQFLTVTETHNCGPITAKSTNTNVVTVSGSAPSLTVHSVAAGSAYIYWYDSRSNWDAIKATVP